MNLLLPRIPIMNSVPLGKTDKYELFVECINYIIND